MKGNQIDMQNHEQLQKHVSDFLESKGYKVNATAYHDYLTETDTNYIAKNYSPSALAYRTQPDLFCCNATEAFYVDLKTNRGPHQNMAIELLPLLVSAMKDKLFNTTTYYIYQDLGKNRRVVEGIRIITAMELLNSVAVIFIDDKMSKILSSNPYPELDSVIRKSISNADPFAIIPFDKVLKFKLLEDVL